MLRMKILNILGEISPALSPRLDWDNFFLFLILALELMRLVWAVDFKLFTNVKFI